MSTLTYYVDTRNEKWRARARLSIFETLLFEILSCLPFQHFLHRPNDFPVMYTDLGRRVRIYVVGVVNATLVYAFQVYWLLDVAHVVINVAHVTRCMVVLADRTETVVPVERHR